MAQLEESFRASLTASFDAAGCQPRCISGPERRIYVGSDRMRDWIQADFWAVLEAHPKLPTILAEVDTSPADLEHNVAKYLWWSESNEPFWQTPALLLSAYRQYRPKDYLIHEKIAAFHGKKLCAAVPGTTHRIVTLRGEPNSEDAGHRLAELVYAEVVRWLEQLR